MDVPRSATVRRSASVAYRALAGEEGGLLLHLETGEYHGLNQVGSAIWKLLEREPTFEELLEALRVQLDGVPPSFEQESGAFLRALEQRGLIGLGDGASAQKPPDKAG